MTLLNITNCTKAKVAKTYKDKVSHYILNGIFSFKQSNKNKMSNTDTNLSIPIFNEWLPMTTFLVRF